MKVLVFTNLYPNVLQPDFGVFIRNRTLALNEKENVEVKVVAPVPYFPPIRIAAKWYRFSQIPLHEIIDDLDVYHPRHLVTPKIGMSFYGWWMFLGVLKTLKQIRKNFPFDVIDAHFLYPDGFAANMLGRYFNCPVMITARGSDVTSYTQISCVRALVNKTLKDADRLVAVSRSLRDIMVDNGAAAGKVTVIPNGIDPKHFLLKDFKQARKKLDFQEDEKIILTVCSLLELKGVHLLIEAVARIKAEYSMPCRLVVIGSGPEKERLNALISKFALNACVQLVGSIPNADLVDWYNAADLFVLGSSREGWPNVVCEALACGTPVVATAVNGIPEILESTDLGMMVERTVEGFAQGIKAGLGKSWNRQLIACKGRQRTWDKVACEVHGLLSGMLSNAEN